MMKRIIILFCIIFLSLSVESKITQNQIEQLKSDLQNETIIEREAPIKIREINEHLNGKWIGKAISYGCYRQGQAPGQKGPSEAEIIEDLQIISQRWNLIRVYNADDDTERILKIIKKHDFPIKVMLGIWLEMGLRIGPGSTIVNNDKKIPKVKKGPYGENLYNHELHPEDIKTIRKITAKGIPVVTVLICGRPLVIEKELAESEAVAVAWFPGSEGDGISDVIFGDYDFQGKLSFSWPRYDDENWNVGDKDYNPLFPYGFGLNYD